MVVTPRGTVKVSDTPVYVNVMGFVMQRGAPLQTLRRQEKVPEATKPALQVGWHVPPLDVLMHAVTMPLTTAVGAE